MTGNGRIKVAMVISHAQASWGGMQKQAFRLAQELQSNGSPTLVLSKRDEDSTVRAQQETLGRVKVIQLPFMEVQPAWSFLISFLTWACLHRKSFDIIHAHNTALGVISALVGWLFGKRVIVKTPGMRSIRYLHGSSWPRRLRRWVLKRKTDRFIAVSREMVQALRECGIPQEKIALIENGIEIGEFDRNVDRAALKVHLLGDPDAQVVLFVGRLVKDKGLHRLLMAWRSLSVREGRVLLIVGDGPLIQNLQNQARNLQLFPSVRFFGHQADVSKFYTVADVFVLPSLTEGMSNSLLEAMVAGLPVVASAVGGNRDVIENGRSGFLVDWDNTEACSELLSTLLDDSVLREQVGEAARQRVSNFSIREVARRYLKLYQTVLQE